MIKIDLSESIVAGNSLRKKAEIFLRSKINSEPNNTNYLLKLSHLLRSQGLIAESLEVLNKILQLEPNNIQVSNLVAILSGQPSSYACKDSFSPTPFFYIKNFLSKGELNTIWETAKTNEKNFSDSEVGITNIEDKTQGMVYHNYRKSITLRGDHLKDISKWLLDKINSQLKEVWTHIQIEPFKPIKTEIHMTRHGNNEFFKIHQDSGSEEPFKDRILTFVYYFHQEPKLFNGGEILLFDTHTDNNECGTHFTKLTPENNSIVFFPSNYFHQVTPVSLKTDLFDNGRFAIHGWLHK